MAFDVVLVPFLQLILTCIKFYRFLIILYIIVGLLIAFNLLNTNGIFIYNIHRSLMQLIEPLLSPIKRVLPNFGMFDFSPIVLILIMQFLSSVIAMTIIKYFPG